MDPVTLATLATILFLGFADKNVKIFERDAFIRALGPGLPRSQASAAVSLGGILYDAAGRYSVSPLVVCGLAYTETRYGTQLDRNGRGDNGHGHGIMQIDNRSHLQWIKATDWKDPYENINYGTKVYKDSYLYCLERLPSGWVQQAAIAGYNTGPARAVANAKAGNVDRTTSAQNGVPYTQVVLKEVDRIFKNYTRGV